MGFAPEWELFDFQYQESGKYLQMLCPAEPFQKQVLSAEGCFLFTLDPERRSSLNLTSWMALGMPNCAPVIWWEWQAHCLFFMRCFWSCHSEQELGCVKLTCPVCLGCCPVSLHTAPEWQHLKADRSFINEQVGWTSGRRLISLYES